LENFSNEARISKEFFSSEKSKKLVSSGFPSVRVPVLSKTM